MAELTCCRSPWRVGQALPPNAAKAAQRPGFGQGFHQVTTVPVPCRACSCKHMADAKGCSFSCMLPFLLA
eukprot:1143942-Pelagomonas_calceolata.AAC.3